MVVASIASYAMNKSKENKENNPENIFLASQQISLGTALLHILDVFLFIFAIYLSFKCNKGFNLGGFLMACCCSAIYIAYKLATGCK
jgi:hypothetical protein